MIAGIWTGAVITVEHIVMLVLGGAGATIIANRLSALRINLNGRMTEMEERLAKVEEAEKSD